MVIYFNKKSEEYISNVEEVSKFTISNNFDFLMVNCFDEKFRKLCIDNKVQLSYFVKSKRENVLSKYATTYTRPYQAHYHCILFTK